MKTTPQASTVPYNPPAMQDTQCPPAPPKTRSATAPVVRKPLSEAEKKVQQKEVEQACRAFMAHLQGDGETPTPDFGADDLLRWYDDYESRVVNLVYMHRSLIKSLILRQSIDPKVSFWDPRNSVGRPPVQVLSNELLVRHGVRRSWPA